MFRILAAVAAVLLATITVTVADAANPHFINASATVNNQGSLVASFKEAGLGNEVTLITLAAHADATFFCVNGGQKNPSAANKRTVSVDTSTTQPFTPRNGQITGSLSLAAPGAGDFSCPNGQRLTLVKIVWTNVSLTDTTHNVSAAIPGTFCRVLDTRFPELSC